MDGIFLIDCSGDSIVGSRPKSKKAVKEAIATNPSAVEIECTSAFGGYSGRVDEAPEGKYHFVGPDPYTKRNFYGTIAVSGGTVKVT